MELTSLAGNPRVKEQLSRREEGRGLSHAYIVSGPEGSGRHTLARLLAAAMVCTAPAGRRPCGACPQCKKVGNSIHPDVISVAGEEGKPISVDQIRDLRKDAHIRPNEGERKIYLLEEADRMKEPAQNAMLKLIEEGPKYAAFLFLAGNSGGLLETVRSRCEQLELVPLSAVECENWLRSRYPKEDPARLKQAALNCQGLLGRAVAELSQTAPAADGAAVRQLADALESGSELQLFEATMLLDKKKGDELIRLLDALERELTGRMSRPDRRRQLMRAVELVKQIRTAVHFNANPGQLAGWLCAGMHI